MEKPKIVILYKFKGLIIKRMDDFTEIKSDGRKIVNLMWGYDSSKKQFEIKRKVIDKKGNVLSVEWVIVGRNTVMKNIQSGKWEFTAGYKPNMNARIELNYLFKDVHAGTIIDIQGNECEVLQKTGRFLKVKFTEDGSDADYSKTLLERLIKKGECNLTPNQVSIASENELSESQLLGLTELKDWMIDVQKHYEKFEYTIDRSKLNYIPLNLSEYHIIFNGEGWKKRDASFNKFWMLILRILRKNEASKSDRNFLNFLRDAHGHYLKTVN